MRSVAASLNPIDRLETISDAQGTGARFPNHSGVVFRSLFPIDLGAQPRPQSNPQTIGPFAGGLIADANGPAENVASSLTAGDRYQSARERCLHVNVLIQQRNTHFYSQFVHPTLGGL